jgi:putative NADH-flavin reductase
MVTSNSNEHNTLETAAGSPTRLFVLGATGGIGRAVVHQALERGDRVTAFVRSPDKLGGPRAGLAVVRGDPRNVDELRVALPNHDAVISSIGPMGLGATTIVGDCAESLVTAMEATGVRRLLVVGVAVLFEHEGFLNTIARRTFLRNVANDSAAMERVVTASSLDWTIVRPPRLTNGPLTRRYGVADGRMPSGARLTVSRADVAHFLLEEFERRAHVQRIVGLASLARSRDSASRSGDFAPLT